MNRQDMVEVGANAIHSQLAGDENRPNMPGNLSQACSRAVLDAVLPQISTVEQIRGLPEPSILMAIGQGNAVPNILMWLDEKLYDFQNDWDEWKPEELVQVFESIQVVWRP